MAVFQLKKSKIQACSQFLRWLSVNLNLWHLSFLSSSILFLYYLLHSGALWAIPTSSSSSSFCFCHYSCCPSSTSPHPPALIHSQENLKEQPGGGNQALWEAVEGGVIVRRVFRSGYTELLTCPALHVTEPPEKTKNYFMFSCTLERKA